MTHTFRDQTNYLISLTETSFYPEIMQFTDTDTSVSFENMYPLCCMRFPQLCSQDRGDLTFAYIVLERLPRIPIE